MSKNNPDPEKDKEFSNINIGGGEPEKGGGQTVATTEKSHTIIGAIQSLGPTDSGDNGKDVELI